MPARGLFARPLWNAVLGTVIAAPGKKKLQNTFRRHLIRYPTGGQCSLEPRSASLLPILLQSHIRWRQGADRRLLTIGLPCGQQEPSPQKCVSAPKHRPRRTRRYQVGIRQRNVKFRLRALAYQRRRFAEPQRHRSVRKRSIVTAVHSQLVVSAAMSVLEELASHFFVFSYSLGIFISRR